LALTRPRSIVGPGPAAFDLSHTYDSRVRAPPAFSLASRTRDLGADDRPAPNAYASSSEFLLLGANSMPAPCSFCSTHLFFLHPCPDLNLSSTSRSMPAFSMSGRFKEFDSNLGPGPASINVAMLDSRVSWTLMIQ
jgi:hypothetical protein